MGRKKLSNEEALRHRVEARINDKKHKELVKLLASTVHKDMSSLVRDILHNRPVKVFTYDRSLDMVMEELAALRAEIRSIGINVNQMTRHFNTYPEDRKKELYARLAFQQYYRLESLIHQLLGMVSKLSKKWLSE